MSKASPELKAAYRPEKANLATDEHGWTRMKKQIRSFICVHLCASVAIFILFFGFSPVWSQQLTTGADFLKIDSGARSQGMGGAFTAMADDVNALTWNPAGIALLPHAEVGYLHMLYLSDIGYNFGGVAIPLPAGQDTWGLGAGIVNLGTPTFDSTLGLAPAVSAGDNAFLLSVAFKAKNIISFGLTGKYILRNIAGYSASAFGGDAGVMILPTDHFRIGLGVFNVGQQVEFISAGDPLPLTGRLGLAWEILDIPHHTLTLAVDNGWQFGSQAYTGAGGMEYWFDKTLALRAGFTGDAYQQHMAAGVGFNLDALEVDYAYAPMGTLGDTHRFSLIVRFGAEGEGLAAPGNFTSKSMDGSVFLKWERANSKDVVGYNIYVKKPNATGLTLVTKRPLGPGETTVKLNRLVNGQSYTFAVASVSAAGRESGLVTLAAIPGGAAPPTTLLLAPTGFKAALDADGFDLTWDRAASLDVAGYNLYLADDQGKPSKKLNAKLLTDPKVNLKKVNPQRAYKFLVTTVNKAGNESVGAPLAANYSDLQKAAMAALLPPPAHLALTAKEGKVYLAWDDAGSGTKYNVYFSHDGASYKLLTKEPLLVPRATLGPLKGGVAYYFGVTSVSADGKESDRVVQSLPASK
jgi:hypothetical protein